MHHYNDIELPAQQGFFVRGMVSDGTLEGTYLPGILTCAAGSYVPAYFHPGEGLVYWDTVEKRTVTFEHKGKWYESIAWFIDDFYDGWNGEYFTGGFYGCDASGNCYGWRSYPNEPMPENGEGTFYTKAVVYNLFNKQWDERDGAYLVGGLWKEIYLLANGDMEINGQNVEPISHFGVTGEAAGYDFVGVSYISNDGRTLVGQYQEFNPATMQYDPFPAVIELSEPLTGVENVTAAEKAVKIQGLEGAIEVEGAQNVAVYDMQGRRVGTTGLAAGIYVVKADETTAKVIVK